MPPEPAPPPEPPPPPAPAADHEITLDEWVAAGQGCCGGEKTT